MTRHCYPCVPLIQHTVRDTKMICNNCKQPKQDDGFRACPDCRQYWREQQRKPDGYVNTVRRLEDRIKQLEKLLEKCVRM